MAKAFISHSSLDKPFVHRLAEDLRSNWIDVWLDEWELRLGDDFTGTIESSLAGSSHLIIVLSERALRSAWVRRELEFAASREKDRLGMTIVPLRLTRVEIPPEVRDKPPVDFFISYDDGLSALLRIFSSARPGISASVPGRRFVSAQRGRAAGLSVSSHLSTLVMGGREWSFAAVVETLGEASLRTHLTRAIHELLTMTLQKFAISGPRSLSQYLQLANAAALKFKKDHGLDVRYPLGAKMAMLVQ
jgi:hypothetical protein